MASRPDRFSPSNLKHKRATNLVDWFSEELFPISEICLPGASGIGVTKGVYASKCETSVRTRTFVPAILRPSNRSSLSVRTKRVAGTAKSGYGRPVSTVETNFKTAITTPQSPKFVPLRPKVDTRSGVSH
ncbi:hypothetical protein M8J77_010219 [Diaphorina citri]|nr:hypothetical protein M8J77_010219 [Diaphorina citri]